MIRSWIDQARRATFWSPRQISATLAAQYPDDEGMRVSHEAIYCQARTAAVALILVGGGPWFATRLRMR